MKYLKTFNESVISGEDFLYKQISSDEYFRFDDTHNTINIERETRDSISNLIKTDKKSEYKQKIGEFSYKISVMKSSVKYKEEDIILFRQYEDNWFIIWDNKEDGEISRFLLCDGFEGVEKYINDEVNTRYIKESVVEEVTYLYDESDDINESVFEGEDFLYKEIDRDEFGEIDLNKTRVVPDEITMDKIYDLIKLKTDYDVDKSLVDDDTGFYNFEILCDDGTDIRVISLEDDWYLLCLSENIGKILASFIVSYYICDGWEGLEKFIDDKI